MPIQAPQWSDYLNCPVCCREFGVPPRSPISLGCGHTVCRHCLNHLQRNQCPFDQTAIQIETDELVVNTALLQLAGYTPPEQPVHPPCIQALAEHERNAYDVIVQSMEHLAAYLKFCGNATANNSVASSRLSRPMQRKLVTLLQCAITDEEGRGRAARAARSLGERTVTELILQHQNPQQLSANLWAAVRARGCQFLGPAMQEEVLKLVLLALEDGSALSRKVLVMFVVQRLEPHFPQASKTSIGHVVQLLYRASCFKVSKRESDSSLMQLKEEFRTYESLRREHDAQIVQIATEAGLRIAPDQWSALLYGDTAHKSHMQSIIDKLQTPQSFAQSVQELFIALQRTGDPAKLIIMSMHLDRLANIDSSPDTNSPSWQQLAEIMSSLKEVVSGLVHYLQQQANGRDTNHNQNVTIQDRPSEPSTSELCPPPPQAPIATPTHNKYKVSMCRDAATRSFCPRGSSCTFAHSEEELERYRTGMPVYTQVPTNGNYPPGLVGPPQPIPPNIPMPQQQMPPQVPQPMPQPMYRYAHQGHIPQRPMDNYTVPPMVPMPNNGMPMEMQFNQEYMEATQQMGYHPSTVIQTQPPPMGLDQNAMMIPMPDRNYWYSNIVPFNEEPTNYIHYPRAEYTRPLYGGPPPMQYPAPEMAPMNVYVPLPPDERSSASPHDNNGFIEQPVYNYIPPTNMPENAWQPNNEAPTFDLDQLRTSLPQCSSMPAQMFRVVGDRRSVGPDRLAAFVDRMATAGAFDFSNVSDDQVLVEELQALERRIDTEYESAD